jgi:RNase P subunit RPR2
MSKHALQPRLQFLKDAAHLLHVQSPTTAAVLGSQYDKLLVDRNLDLEASQKEWDAHRRDICGACGNLLIPGLSCQVSQETTTSEGNKGRKAKKPKGDVQKAMVHTCSRCDTRTIQPIPAPPPARFHKRGSGISKSQSQHSSNAKATILQDDAAPKSANASSKKRAKTRKQGGLQALVDKSKNNSRKGDFGLDLMDFIKSS